MPELLQKLDRKSVEVFRECQSYSRRWTGSQRRWHLQFDIVTFHSILPGPFCLSLERKQFFKQSSCVSSRLCAPSTPEEGMELIPDCEELHSRAMVGVLIQSMALKPD